jgi:hypothetical protein
MQNKRHEYSSRMEILNINFRTDKDSPRLMAARNHEIRTILKKQIKFLYSITSLMKRCIEFYITLFIYAYYYYYYYFFMFLKNFNVVS